MLGHKVFQHLRERFPPTKCTIRGALADPLYGGVELFKADEVIQDFDATDLTGVRRCLATVRPSFVVNCIGVIKQHADGNRHIPNLLINSLLPHIIAEELSVWGGKLIHLSTDCVFSGSRGRYLESDDSDATDLYGKTKFLGEVETDNALTLRTSFIGRELRNFRSLLEWFLASEGKTVQGYVKAIFSGLTTNALAKLVGELIDGHPTLTGLYQVASEQITKYELLCLVRDSFELNIEIVPSDELVVNRSLVGDRFLAATGLTIPSWPSMLEELTKDPTPYGRWR